MPKPTYEVLVNKFDKLNDKELYEILVNKYHPGRIDEAWLRLILRRANMLRMRYNCGNKKAQEELSNRVREVIHQFHVVFDMELQRFSEKRNYKKLQEYVDLLNDALIVKQILSKEQYADVIIDMTHSNEEHARNEEDKQKFAELMEYAKTSLEELKQKIELENEHSQ